MTAYFIKCAAREKRSPTCLNYGQFVEDKTTENKKVVPLFLQTQQTISNSSTKKVILVTNVFVHSMFSLSFYLDRYYRHP